MTRADVPQVLEAIRPQRDIERLCAPCGVIERRRPGPLGRLVRAMVIAAGTPGGAYQADVRRSSLECEVSRVARSACYRGFETPRAQIMTALADPALAYAQAQTATLTGMLGGVKDWSFVDATTVRVRAVLRAESPGTGAYEALKVHTVRSGGGGAPVRYHFSPAREPDSRPLQRDASWQWYGLLAARASACLAWPRACNPQGGAL